MRTTSRLLFPAEPFWCTFFLLPLDEALALDVPMAAVGRFKSSFKAGFIGQTNAVKRLINLDQIK